MSPTADDPMDGAAIGETRTVRVEDEVNPWFRSSINPMLGSDRDCADLRVVDARITGESGDEHVILEYEADVTKTLPLAWDRPLDEHPKHRSVELSARERWAARIGKAIGMTIPVIVATVGAYWMTQPIDGVAIVGEPITAPGIWFFVAMGLFMLFLLWLIPMLPGMAGPRGRYA